MIATQTNISKTKTRVLNIILILVGGALFLVLLLRSRLVYSPVLDVTKSYDALISIGSKTIPVTIADTEEERNLGLSGTKSLNPDTGKLFVFDSEGVYGFWMKDMSYDIDIIWIDSDFRVIAINKAVSKDSYPEIFLPPKEVSYVLEVPSGFSTDNNITENQLMSFSQELLF
ncbi:MAG: uncharacterized protein QG674_81 [Patescibacteria group bacterium]|jgi:uncharacterized membrane protein (UPF0127 family)|nr:uncharacterized protein [Patescibacteria group bacterium]